MVFTCDPVYGRNSGAGSQKKHGKVRWEAAKTLGWPLAFSIFSNGPFHACMHA